MAKTKDEQKTRITPLGDRVLVKRFAATGKSEGGILIPTTAQDQQNKGEVIAVGRGRKLNQPPEYSSDPLITQDYDVAAAWPRVPLDVKVGDHVLFQSYGGDVIEQGDDELVLLREEDITAILSQDG